LVILTHPFARLKTRQDQEEFLAYLNAEKLTTKLVLVEYEFLTSERERRNNNLHWLEKWAISPQQANRVYLRHFSQPTGGMLVRWIQDHVKSQGGQITPQAAMALAGQVGDDTRLAANEVAKLLTYANYARPVDVDDIEHLTPQSARVGDFDLVNAIRDREGRKAQALLQRSLQDDDPLRLLQSIVYQIRVLIIAHEIMDDRLTVNDFPRELRISPYPAKLAMESVPRFSMKFLDSIYHRLLEIDESIKTGQLEPELALELLVIELTS
jgi:DNA polymerase-3 subunit delta